MSTPPPAMELTLRNDRRSRRVLCMGHLTVGGSIYSSAERSEVGKRDCGGIMRKIGHEGRCLKLKISRSNLRSKGDSSAAHDYDKVPLLPAALPSSTGLLKSLSYTKREYAA